MYPAFIDRFEAGMKRVWTNFGEEAFAAPAVVPARSRIS
jgi:hypothetical protein